MTKISIDAIQQALRGVDDPDLGQNIVDLGLVVDVDTSRGDQVAVTMTLTTPHHPRAEEVRLAAQEAVLALPGVRQAEVELVWQPAWTPYRMADDLKEALGLPALEPESSWASAASPTRPAFRRLLSRVKRIVRPQKDIPA